MDADPVPVAVSQPALEAALTTTALDDRGKSTTVHTTQRSNDGSTDGFEDVFPGDKGALSAWIVLLGSFLTLFPTFGLMVSIGTLQDYWSSHQLSSFSARDIGWIPSVLVYITLAGGLCFGPLFDRYGPRWIVLIGSAGYIVMLFSLAECTEYYQFMLCLGVLGGTSAAALTTAALAIISHWFKTKRGLASGIAMVGNSLGGVIVPLVLRSTLSRYGYPWSIRILGFVFSVCLVVSNVLIRPRFPPSPDARKAKIFGFELFGSPAFTFLTASVFGIEVVLFGMLGILPTYATASNSFPPQTGFYLIAALNGMSCLGRIIPGFLSDYWGRFNVLGITMIFVLLVILIVALPFAQTSLVALYLFAVTFGFGTGTWMAMVPACIGTLSGPHHFGRYFGTSYFIASLATLICVPISGELLETVGGKALIGFMAAVLAFSIVLFAISRSALLGWRWKWIFATLGTWAQ